MLVACPTCKTRYRIDGSRLRADGVHLQCCRCNVVFRVAGKMPMQIRASSANSRERTGKPLTLVVANESPDFCATVERILRSEPFRIFCCHDGGKAMELIREHCPDAVLLDVALPTLYGFEICERIRTNPELSGVKTILIASIYDKTRYKREPQSLYGADDYIEEHHMPDSLAAKIYGLVSGRKPVSRKDEDAYPGEEERPTDLMSVSPRELRDQEMVREELRRDEGAGVVSCGSAHDEEAHHKARRLARIIIADIALYNRKKVEEGVRNGTFHELLEEELQEGKSYFDRKISEQVRRNTSYLEDAVAEFLSKKKVELGSS